MTHIVMDYCRTASSTVKGNNTFEFSINKLFTCVYVTEYALSVDHVTSSAHYAQDRKCYGKGNHKHKHIRVLRTAAAMRRPLR